MISLNKPAPFSAVFIGLDTSLSCTGFAVMIFDKGKQTGGVFTKALHPAKGFMNGARLCSLDAALRNELAGTGMYDFPRFAAMEGYAMAGSGRVTGLAEWGGVVKLALHRAGIPVLLIAPMTLKLVATGHGHVDKGGMVRAMQKLIGGEIETEDEADAVALAWCAAQRVFGQRPSRASIPNKQTAALWKPQWALAGGMAPDWRPAPARKRRA